MMFVTPVLRTRREVQHTFLKAMEAMEAKVANAQILFRGLWAISKEPSLHRGDTQSGELGDETNIAAALSFVT